MPGRKADLARLQPVAPRQLHGPAAEQDAHPVSPLFEQSPICGKRRCDDARRLVRRCRVEARGGDPQRLFVDDLDRLHVFGQFDDLAPGRGKAACHPRQAACRVVFERGIGPDHPAGVRFGDAMGDAAKVLAHLLVSLIQRVDRFRFVARCGFAVRSGEPLGGNPGIAFLGELGVLLRRFVEIDEEGRGALLESGLRFRQLAIPQPVLQGDGPADKGDDGEHDTENRVERLDSTPPSHHASVSLSPVPCMGK